LLNSGQIPENYRVFIDRFTPTQSFGDIITVPIAFFIGAGFFWLVARVFGGQGTFLQHSWLLALVYVPITAASTLLSLIPVLGALIGLGLGIYGIVLSIFAIAAAHRMSVGKSAAVVLIPGAIALLLILCAFAVIVAIFAGSTLGR
ncbi:MAG TPA: YIP1 family protein, partial [Ktedonobacterales bacterium]